MSDRRNKVEPSLTSGRRSSYGAISVDEGKEGIPATSHIGRWVTVTSYKLQMLQSYSQITIASYRNFTLEPEHQNFGSSLMPNAKRRCEV
jgi:hypothetical protein